MSHERKCYKNPDTKSCASCLFLKQEHIQYIQGYSFSLLTCLRNHNTPNKLKTGCNDYHYKKEKYEIKVMQQIKEAYNPMPFIQPYIGKHLEAHDRKMKENQESHDGHNLQKERNIGWNLTEAPF
jgi:hypothetical protein